MNETPPIKAVQKRAETKTIRDLITGDQFKLAVQQSLPKHLTADRFVRIALTALTRQPKLQQCDQHSFFNCLLTLSQLGLEPDGRRAHLIPFENRKLGVTECQLIVDYKGLAELVMRSGLVSKLHADVVCENDEFEYDRGELKRHKIDFKKPRGAPYAAYSLVAFKDGTEKCDVMGKDEIETVRKRSRAGNNGPWITDPSEMWKKTVFRRQSKLLPLSPELRDAVEADDEALEEQRFAAAIPVGSSFELPPSRAKTEFRVADREPTSGTATDQPGDGAEPSDAVPADSGLSAQPSPGVAIGTEATAVAVDHPGKQPPSETTPQADAGAEKARTIQDDLASAVLAVPGAKFIHLHTVATALGWFTQKQADNWSEFSDISDNVARRLYGARASLAGKIEEAVRLEGAA